MEFGRNRKGLCGKKAKWSLGEMGKLGEMASWRNEKWAKMKLSETAKGQNRYWAEWEKGRTDIGRNGKRAKLERAKEEWPTREKFGRNGNGRNGIGQTRNKPF